MGLTRILSSQICYHTVLLQDYVSIHIYFWKKVVMMQLYDDAACYMMLLKKRNGLLIRFEN